MKNISKAIEKIEKGDAWEDSDTVVELKVKKPLDKVIPIRIQEEHWRLLMSEAKQLGIGPSTLARMWIIERLRQTENSYKHNLDAIENRLFTEQVASKLSDLELNILERIVKGQFSQDIISDLHIDPDRFQKYLQTLFDKLQQKTMEERIETLISERLDK